MRTGTVCALVPLKSTVPVPAVKVPLLVTVNVPPILSVPPLVMVRTPSLDPAPPSATFPPTVNWPVPPLTKVTVPVRLSSLLFTVSEAQTAVAVSTLTVSPPRMVTVSAAAGTPPAPLHPDHVVPVFQLPPPVLFELQAAA